MRLVVLVHVRRSRPVRMGTRALTERSLYFRTNSRRLRQIQTSMHGMTAGVQKMLTNVHGHSATINTKLPMDHGRTNISAPATILSSETFGFRETVGFAISI